MDKKELKEFADSHRKVIIIQFTRLGKWKVQDTSELKKYIKIGELGNWNYTMFMLCAVYTWDTLSITLIICEVT